MGQAELHFDITISCGNWNFILSALPKPKVSTSDVPVMHHGPSMSASNDIYATIEHCPEGSYTSSCSQYSYKVHMISFQTFFIWALLLIVHTWNSSPLQSNLLRLQCTCTVSTTSGRPHGGPLVWACQWPSSQPLSSPQLSHNDSLWAYGITKSHREQGLDYTEAEDEVLMPILLK